MKKIRTLSLMLMSIALMSFVFTSCKMKNAMEQAAGEIIEEVTDMSGDIMEKLTDIISSGVIQINKANGHERTNARTRLFFVSNTKRGAKLESYMDVPSAFR